MTKMLTAQRRGDNAWFEEITSELKNNASLTNEDLEKIITNAIAEYVAETIDVTQLVEIVFLLENTKVKLTPDMTNIIADLSLLQQHQSDTKFVYNILIDVLRKITKD